MSAYQAHSRSTPRDSGDSFATVACQVVITGSGYSVDPSAPRASSSCCRLAVEPQVAGEIHPRAGGGDVGRRLLQCQRQVAQLPGQIVAGRLFGALRRPAGARQQELRKLADAVPPDLADAFIMFAKTEAFTVNEVRLAQTLNSEYRLRVILWSVDELEPYHVYERAEARLGHDQYATTLTDMARVTQRLWLTTAPSADQ